MPTMTDERRFGVAVQFTKPVRPEYWDTLSTVIAKALWHAELRIAPVQAEWVAELQGGHFTVTTTLPTTAVIRDEPLSERYFGGNLALLRAGLDHADPVQIADEVYVALSHGYNAADAERDANLPRLKALVREALERGGV